MSATATVTYFLMDFAYVFPRTDPATFATQFLSKAEISTNTAKQNQLDKYFYSTENQMLNEMYTLVAKKTADGPVILFTDSNEDAIEEKMNNIYGPSMGFYRITSNKDAFRVRLQMNRRESGVFVLGLDCARRFDLKLAKDAYVIIASQGDGFPHSIVNQMLGCGCRSFGVANGAYLTCRLHRSVHLEEILKSLEPDFKQGAAMLDYLYTGYTDLNSVQKKTFRQFCLTEKWRMKVKDFEEREPKVFRLLTGGDTAGADGEKKRKISS